MKLVVDEFQAWRGLPNVQGAIDGTLNLLHILKTTTITSLVGIMW
jgi:hypothetical protein